MEDFAITYCFIQHYFLICHPLSLKLRLLRHRQTTGLTLTKSKSHHNLEIREAMRTGFVQCYLYFFIQLKMKSCGLEKSISKLIHLDERQRDQKNLVQSICRKIINT